jgi:hypothetical protein
MHYSIDPEDIKAEIAKLGHTVTNIWNAKHYRTKQPLSVLYSLPLTRRKYFKWNICNSAKSASNRHGRHVTLPNVQTVRGMGIPGIFATSNQGA